MCSSGTQAGKSFLTMLSEAEDNHVSHNVVNTCLAHLSPNYTIRKVKCPLEQNKQANKQKL